jgi:tripartite-type tricarboxylate transporter receptor subunit TctC
MSYARLAAAALVFSAALASAQAYSQPYPSRPIRVIVPFPPGGPTDIVARIIGQKLGERWRQQIVVDNRPGAAGNVGAEIGAHAPPDGYTLVMGSTANMAVSPTLYPKLNYDPIKDFVPISLAAVTPNLLVVHPGMPAQSVKDLIALAKAQRGRMNYATGGAGTPSHLAAELFKTMAGIDMTHVPYKGSIPALTDIVAGNVALMFDSMASALGFVKSGKLKVLAQTGATRSPTVPDVPTISESGLPGYDVVGWFGVFAPAGTPPAIVKRLSVEIEDILTLRDVQERYVTIGAQAGGKSPEQFRAFVDAEIRKWAKVIKTAGVRAE